MFKSAIIAAVTLAAIQAINLGLDARQEMGWADGLAQIDLGNSLNREISERNYYNNKTDEYMGYGGLAQTYLLDDE